MSSKPQIDCLRNFRGVVDGSRAAHVWLSDCYPGAPMARVFTEAGVIVGKNDHGLPKGFAEAIGLQYGGEMTPEQAQLAIEQRLSAPDRVE